jgi:signal transduction histidine kinase
MVGGRFQVESVPGQGTTVTAQLPPMKGAARVVAPLKLN